MGLSVVILVGEIATDVQRRKVGEADVAGFRLNDGKSTHNVSVFEPPEGLHKGALVVVQGRLSNRNTAKQGDPARWITEVTGSGKNVTVIGGGEEDDGLSFG